MTEVPGPSSLEALPASEAAEPRTSTPHGPHPMSPPKQPPSPIPAESSTAPEASEESLVHPLGSNRNAASPTSDQGRSLQGLGVGLADVARPRTEATSNVVETHGNEARAIIEAETTNGAQGDVQVRAQAQAELDPHSTHEPPVPESSRESDGAAPQPNVDNHHQQRQSPPSPTERPKSHRREERDPVPDWITDDIDESWREPDRSTSGPNPSNDDGARSETPATGAGEGSLIAAPGQDPQTVTLPSLGSVRLPKLGLGSRSASAGAGRTFFDARESPGLHGLRSSQTQVSSGRGRHPALSSGSLTDAELQAGPSTPSKRKPSHSTRKNGTARDGGADETHRSTSRSPASAPDDFESARASFIDRSAVSLHPGSSGAAVPDGSVSDGAMGTFIHRADVSSLPPILRPAWQKQDREGNAHSPQKRGITGIGGDIFTPMKLERLFRSPTPPEQPPASLNPAICRNSTVATEAKDQAREKDDETPRVKSDTLISPPRASQPAPMSQLTMPSSVFTFRSPQTAALQPIPAEPQTPASHPRALQRSVAHARPVSAAAALVPTDPVPPTASRLISAPSTPHTPMRPFKFNYEDAATRARLEMLVNRNGAPTGRGPLAGETERERKRLRLDVKPRKVMSGDMVSLNAAALGSSPGPLVAVDKDADPSANAKTPSHSQADEMVAGHRARHSDKHGLQQGQALERHDRQQRGSAGGDMGLGLEVAASPSKSVLLPPVVDYVKEAPTFMSALQQQMVRVASDATSSSSKTWITDDEDDASADAEGSGMHRGVDVVTLSHEASFHQGSVPASPTRAVTSPARRWKQRRSAVRAARDRDQTDELNDLSRSPSYSPLRLSTRRLPPTSSLHGDAPRAGEAQQDESMPPMSSTLKSRKTWISKAGSTVREDESPRKLLRRYSAAAQAEEEALNDAEDYYSSYRERSQHNGQDLGDVSKNWSDESFRRDQKIKELEEKLAIRNAEKSRTNGSWLRNGEDIGGDEEGRQEALARPQLITLHEPTLEDAHDLPIQGSGRAHRGEDIDDRSETWDDDLADVQDPPGARRIQDGIVLYDSEKVYAPPHSGGPSKPLRNAVSEAQLRPPALRDPGTVRASDHQVAPGRETSEDAHFMGPRHPSTAAPLKKPTSSSSRFLSSGHEDEEGRRGERTVSSNTLVDDRTRYSYDSRASLNVGGVGPLAARNPFGVVADPSSTVNSLGATITRKGSMLNISQIPDKGVEQLGGENFRYDRERNRWVKVSKKPSSESLRAESAMQSAALDHVAADYGDATRGRGSALGRRSTTRTPVEPTIPEASVENSNAEAFVHLGATPQKAPMRRSDKYGHGKVIDAIDPPTPAARSDANAGQDSRFSDSSDPFKDFESFGQSTTAAEESHAEARGKDHERNALPMADVDPEPAHSTPHLDRAQEARQRPVMTAANSQPALRPQPSPTLAQPRIFSAPPAPASVHRPINTMPRAGSALRNVINYSPDTTVRSSGSEATVTGTHNLEERLATSPARGSVDHESQHEAVPLASARNGESSGARRSRAHASAHPLPSPASARSALVEERKLNPATPERGDSAARNFLTPTLADRQRSDTPPRSILKPSPSALGVAGERHESGAIIGLQSPGPGSVTKTISFADAHTLHRYAGGGGGSSIHRNGSVHQEAENGDLSQSVDAEWSGGEEEEDEEREGWEKPRRRGRPSTYTQTANEARTARSEAISIALRQLAELTLEQGPEDQPVSSSGATKVHDGPRSGTPSARKMGANSTVGRSPWSYAALRRPRRVRKPYRGGGDGDEDEDTYDELHGYPDMTLLTDASFNVAHDKILEVITDVEPWEPGWEELKAIDLSERRVESCLRLKEFLPSLEEVNLDRNEVAYLTGLPSTLRSLSVSRNRITQLASFGQLLNLETLDISYNQIESLSHLECLRHLHTLIADYTEVSSLDGIDRLRSLVHVSLSGNLLKGVNLERTEWRDLESLNLSHNALITVRGLGTLRRLRSLNLDHNRLSRVDLGPLMPKLRAMRVSGNPTLTSLDVLPAKRLRTLYADYCALESIENLESLTRLDNLSMRQQADARVVWPARHLRDTRRLFFSGNAFPQGLDFKALPSSTHPELDLRQPTPMIRFLNLVYLELAACQLTALPVELPELAPNLRSLNLDHNLISTLPSLAGMQRLKRLSVVGCRIKKSKSIIRAVRGLSELQVLDTRTNPCTLGLYPPLMVPPTSFGGATDPSRPFSGEQEAVALDLATAAARLPPVPNPAIVQPDRARQERNQAERARQAALRVAEKSYFHKRHPRITDPALYENDDDNDDHDATDSHRERNGHAFTAGPTSRAAGGAGTTPNHSAAPSVTALFLAADRRFFNTLPRGFKDKRTLHRGLMAMSCPRLNWVDGLFLEEEEIVLAEELVRAQQEVPPSNRYDDEDR